MTLLIPEENEVFEVQIQKRLVDYPSREWVNNYALKAGTSPTFAALEVAVSSLCDFEAALHNDKTEIFRSKVWLTGTVNKFRLQARALTGSIVVDTSDPEPLETVLLVSKTPAVGRTGVAAYRDCLQEKDVSRSNGVPVLSDFASIQTRITDAVDTNISDYLSDGGGEYTLVKWSSPDRYYIKVASIDLKDVGTRNLHNRWFNRST